MKDILSKWEPKDVIAVIALVGCIILLALGYNSTVHWIFGGIIAAYVGIDIAFFRKGDQ
jgi:hypothetical protein